MALVLLCCLLFQFSVKSAGSLRHQRCVDPLVSPPGEPTTQPVLTVTTPTETSSVERGFLQRRCSLIKEESVEERDEDDSDGKISSIRYSKSTEESLSDDSDSRSYSSEHNESPSHLAPPKQRRNNTPVRPLHSVRSSPQLLNQIFEEGEESEEEDTLLKKSPQLHTIAHRTTVASPEMLRKYEKHRKRLTPTQRQSNYSSSDTSDTDETDPTRRRKLKHRFQRRDSSDHSSDTDGTGGPAGGFSAGSHSLQGSASRSSRNTDSDKTKGSRKTSQGKSSGNSARQQNGLANGCLEMEVSRKVSNISLASSVGSGSVGGKYVLPCKLSASLEKLSGSETLSDVDALNEENKARSQIIHVRSKEFTDLMDKFSSSNKEELLPAGFGKREAIKFRKRSKDKLKMDINRNGLVAHAEPAEEEEQQQKNNVIKTKCCSVI